ncbi:hypothetical protein ABFS82_04G017500 [Erythranthe guttata]|uniref:homeobox protein LUMINIDEPENDENS n=1 Tax=Erythranthe guttata TaxID=4155 RepID=UPI00064E0B73|nr:PREDICTED: homeobox protein LUMINIDEPENDENS [Erythranthe guttata]|eukprot:XP_012833312.1 PREDICTED: homeobox protein LUMINIDEPENDENS [Erythranthe guttata]
MEIVVPTTTSYENLLDAQKDLFQNQIEKLHQIVATQCELTGINPLSQEMAAGALSIKIGKRPRDLLNPKAVKYMQFVFSIKDSTSKRETLEISAQFGVTKTQVRDFFTGQRSRVRKMVRLSGEKGNKSTACDAIHDDTTSLSDSNRPPEPVPLYTMAPVPINIEEGPSCSKSDDVLSAMGDPDLHFVNNILSSMKKEESFSEQVKLLRSILRMNNPTLINWFLSEGGLMILATWLCQAAKEEQTSFLRVILKVLYYLPMHKALPVHMSAILQSVNKLRFYRTSDISHRARTLLSKWSNMFGKNLPLKKSNGLKSASELQDEMLLKQSINEVIGNESWDLKDSSEEAFRLLCDNPDNHGKLDSAQPLKMLTASGEDSNKRRGVLSSNNRERRKVQLVEHPGQRLAVRSPQVARSTSATQSRPLSADDIQKSKMRAQFMQSKHGKAITGPDEKLKSESKNTLTSSHASLPPVSTPCVQTELEENRKCDEEVRPESKNTVTSSHASLPSVSTHSVQTELEEKRKHDEAFSEPAKPQEEPPRKKHQRIPIPWRTPPEVKIMESWSVAEGANSKEVEVQKNRIRREREIFYRSFQEIPSNPREPWDREMDPDDTLTPEIPIEQLPDVEPSETLSASANNETLLSASSENNIHEPDLQLLAELLKNPELVFALTSGGGGNVTSEATLKLLGIIRKNGVGSLANLVGKADVDEVVVSLPSPTPSTNHVPNGAKQDFSRNPFSRQPASGIGSTYHATGGALPIRQPQIPAQMVVPPPVASLQTNTTQLMSEHWQAHTNSQMHHQSIIPPNSFNTQQHLLNANSNRAPPNSYGSSSSHTNWGEPSSGNIKPSPVSILMPPSRSLTPPHHQKPAQMQDPFGANYRYQNNQSVGNYDAYAGGSVQGGRSSRHAGGPGFESWSPDNSPSRRHEYLPGHYYQDPNVNARAMQQNMGQPSDYYQDQRFGGPANRRWPENRR